MATKPDEKIPVEITELALAKWFCDNQRKNWREHTIKDMNIVLRNVFRYIVKNNINLADIVD